MHQLVTQAVRDAVTGEAVLAGPEIDDHEARRRYRKAHPERVYAAAKRQLSRRKRRRHGLTNDPETPTPRKGPRTDLPQVWPSPPRYVRP